MHRTITGLVLAISMSGALWAQDVVPGNPQIENTIQSQIDAFLQDDFATAFTFASPNIKGMFGTPENFGRMVKQGYPMVWRPKDVDFGDLIEFDGGLYQTVILQDNAGALHYLAYQMTMIDGAWRISGVRFMPAPEVAA